MAHGFEHTIGLLIARLALLRASGPGTPAADLPDGDKSVAWRPARWRTLLPTAAGDERSSKTAPRVVPVLGKSELAQNALRRVEVEGVGVLLSRSSAGEVCAIAATCNHFSGPLQAGDRQGDTVVCPLHNSRFDLCSGEVIDGPAVFPQSRYETRVRDGNIEVRAATETFEKVR